MKETNKNNNLPQAFPIPEESIFIDQELKLSNRLELYGVRGRPEWFHTHSIGIP